MSHPRIQVDPSFDTPTLKPAARPTDTFVEQHVRPTEAGQLAQALSNFVPSLARFGDVLFEKKKAADLAAGTQQARDTVQQLDQSRTTYADAVRTGRIPAHQNPWMKQGYYEEIGRTYAGRLQADMTAAIEKDPNLQNSIEMSDFRTFTSKFEKQWLDQNVPPDQRNDAFQVGYGNRRDAIVANLEAGWANQTEMRFKQRTLAMFRDEAVTYMQDALDKNQTPEQIGVVLKQMLDDKHALGWDASQTGRTLVDAVSDIALEHKDIDLMKTLLKGIPRGPGEPDHSYVINKTQDMSEAIFRARTQDREDQASQQQAGVIALKTGLMARFEEAQKNGVPPQKVAIDDLQQQAIKLGEPDLVTHIQTVADAYKNQEYTDNNQVQATLLNKLHRGPWVLRQSELDGALSDKNLSLATYNSMSNELELAHRQAEDRAKTAKPYLADDPDRNAGIAILDRMFAASSPDEDLPMVRYRAEQAKEQFDTWYAQTYRGEAPAPSSPLGEARKKEVEQFVNSLHKVWYPVDDSFGGTHKLSGSDMNWTSRPVDIPDRLDPALTELAQVINGKATPSPYLTSLLQVYQVNIDSKADMVKFLGAQRRFVPLKEKKPSGARP
jgi:hypothetical protein